MGELEEAKAKAAAAYNAAADYFDHPVSSFWRRFGRQTVERLGLRQGEAVLDVCCGSGGSALSAADAVGPKGKVVAVDLAERLMNLHLLENCDAIRISVVYSAATKPA